MTIFSTMCTYSSSILGYDNSIRVACILIQLFPHNVWLGLPHPEVLLEYNSCPLTLVILLHVLYMQVFPGLVASEHCQQDKYLVIMFKVCTVLKIITHWLIITIYNVQTVMYVYLPNQVRKFWRRDSVKKNSLEYMKRGQNRVKMVSKSAKFGTLKKNWGGKMKTLWQTQYVFCTVIHMGLTFPTQVTWDEGGV